MINQSSPTNGWMRLAALAGLAWFPLFAVGAIVLQGAPLPYDKPIPEVREFFADKGTRYLVGDYIAELAFIFLFLPFVAALRSRLGVAEGGAEIGSRLLFAGGLATVLIGGAATSFLDALALSAGDPALDDSTVRALLYADAVAIAAVGIPAALMAIAASAVIWNTGVLWRWLAVLGVAAAGLQIAGAAFPIEEDPRGVLWGCRFVGFILFAIFISLSSINMLMGNEQVARAAEETSDRPKPASTQA